jgi:ABC-2 type transport system permease protein
MRGFAVLAWTDLKLYLRNVVAVFFTLAFPVLMVLLFGAMYGNRSGVMDAAVPGYVVALVIGSAACTGLPIDLAARRQSGVLRRLRAAPVPVAAVLASHLLVAAAVSALGSAFMVAVARVGWRVRLPANGLLLVPAFALCVVALSSLGMVMGAVTRSVKSTLALTMALFYPMMFLSGGTIPVELFPESLRKVSALLPMSWGVDLLRGVWLRGRWDVGATALLSGALLGFGLLSGVLLRKA